MKNKKIPQKRKKKKRLSSERNTLLFHFECMKSFFQRWRCCCHYHGIEMISPPAGEENCVAFMWSMSIQRDTVQPHDALEYWNALSTSHVPFWASVRCSGMLHKSVYSGPREYLWLDGGDSLERERVTTLKLYMYHLPLSIGDAADMIFVCLFTYLLGCFVFFYTFSLLHWVGFRLYAGTNPYTDVHYLHILNVNI